MKIAFIYALAAICTRFCKLAGECRRTWTIDRKQPETIMTGKKLSADDLRQFTGSEPGRSGRLRQGLQHVFLDSLPEPQFQ
jgi:hypothetical protein